MLGPGPGQTIWDQMHPPTGLFLSFSPLCLSSHRGGEVSPHPPDINLEDSQAVTSLHPSAFLPAFLGGHVLGRALCERRAGGAVHVRSPLSPVPLHTDRNLLYFCPISDTGMHPLKETNSLGGTCKEIKIQLNLKIVLNTLKDASA